MSEGVLFFFGALAVWVGLFIRGAVTHSFRPFIVFGIGLMLLLNLRFLIEGASGGIAFFIGIYDVLINIGLAPGDTREGVMACPDNACTVWAQRYLNHSAWGVAFYQRFASGPQFRSLLFVIDPRPYAVGSIKVMPESWQELFFPEIHHLKGS